MWGDTQSPKAPVSRAHANFEPAWLPVNANVAEPVATVDSGPEVIVVSGGAGSAPPPAAAGRNAAVSRHGSGIQRVTAPKSKGRRLHTR